MVARHRGAARVSIIDIAEGPLAVAAGLGFDSIAMPDAPAPTLIERFDTVFEASGAAPALANGFAVLRRGGTMVQIGNYAQPTLSLPSNLLMGKEISWHGSLRFGGEFSEAVELIASGALDVAPLISARIALSDAHQAFALALDRRRSVKVILTQTESIGETK